MISADEALQRLRDGNSRYVSETSNNAHLVGQDRRNELVGGQAPFAIVLSCSDSRVPAEMVFDQGLGDLFGIRVAGNVVTPSGLGSIEFAATQFGTPLVVVMGHSHCGAVKATLEGLKCPPDDLSPNLMSIVSRIQPAVEGLVSGGGQEGDDLLSQAIKANIAASVDQLKQGSAILDGLIEKGDLTVVGAEYSLQTGMVEIF
ncbi:MAG: carbonic anhydrase [Verrucomicrobiota bacterium]